MRATSLAMRVQRCLAISAERQVRVTDDAGCNLGSATIGVLLSDIQGMRRLADRTKMLRTGTVPVLARFHIDGCPDIMPGGEIIQQVIRRISRARRCPDMMMRIDDWTFPIEYDFLTPCQPGLVDESPVERRVVWEIFGAHASLRALANLASCGR